MRGGSCPYTPHPLCYMGKLRQGGDAVQQRGVTHGVGAASGGGTHTAGDPRVSPPGPAPQCREVRKHNSSEWCRFVRGNPDCQLEGGFLDYLGGVFCVFPPGLLPLAVTLYVRTGTWGAVGCAPHALRLSPVPPPTGPVAPLPLRHPRRDSREVVSTPRGRGDAPRAVVASGGPIKRPPETTTTASFVPSQLLPQPLGHLHQPEAVPQCGSILGTGTWGGTHTHTWGGSGP